MPHAAERESGRRGRRSAAVTRARAPRRPWRQHRQRHAPRRRRRSARRVPPPTPSRPGPPPRIQRRSWYGAAGSLVTDQRHCGGVLSSPRRIPVASAVERELGDSLVADVGAEQLATGPALAAPVPGFLHFEDEPGRRRIEPPPRHRPLPGASGEPQRDAVPGAGGLQPPGRHGEVAEHVRGEQAVRHRTGLKEPDELLGERVGAGLMLGEGGGGHDDTPAAARLAPTTATFASRASFGLNSTIWVLAVTTGVCPAG